MRRLMLALSIACFIAAPIAFAHGHRATASSSTQSPSRSGFDHHGFASANDRGAAHDNRWPRNGEQDRPTEASANQRSHERVPDEEEV